MSQNDATLAQPGNTQPLTGSRVRSTAQAHCIGMLDAKRACEIADELFASDDDLGVLFIHADGFAVNIRGGAEGRRRFNTDWAREEQRRRRERIASVS